MNYLGWLRTRIASTIGVSEEDVDADAPFTRFGIDSVEALAITVDLEDITQRRLPTTLVWDYPTIAKLTGYLEGTVSLPAPASGGSIPPPSVRGPDPSLYDIRRFDEYRDLRFKMRLARVKTIGNPYFKVSTGVSRDVITIGEREYSNYATYNYLGLSGHPRVVEAARSAAETYGTSCSASRTTSGEKPIHVELERQIAELLEVDDAAVFVGGYTTNVSFIGHFLGPEDLVLHDELAHDSILQGAKLSGASRVPFRHNDVASLRSFLANRRTRYRRVLIAVEGVYSTDGDVAPLKELVQIKKEFGALLMVDEAHSIGTLGARGGGIREHAGVRGSDVDVWMGTLSKAFSSCGGYIAGSKALIELVKYASPGFIYSVGMTPANAAMARESIRLMLEEPHRVRDAQARARFFLDECKRVGLDTGLSNGSTVVPVIVGDSLQCMRLAQALFGRGIHVTPMVHPAVPNDKARLRFFVSALHREDQLRETARIVVEELDKIKKAYPGSFKRLRATPVLEPKNAAIAREGFEGFTKGDLGILARQLHERAHFFFPGRSPLSGFHVGREAILDLTTRTFELAEGRLAIDLEGILSDSNHGILLWRSTAHREDATMDGRLCEILDIEDESVIAGSFYLDDSDGFDAFIGTTNKDYARATRHSRAADRAGDTDEARTLRTAFASALAGDKQKLADLVVPGAQLALHPGLGRPGQRSIDFTSIGEHFAPGVALGADIDIDLAVCDSEHAVVRVVVTEVGGYVGSLCVVGTFGDGGRIVSGWLSTDAPNMFEKMIAAER